MRHGTHNSQLDNLQQKQVLADLLLQIGEADVYPASLAQQRLWFLDQMQGGSSAYNVHLGLWLRGPLSLDALRASLQELVNRHDSLRTAFTLDRYALRQVVRRTLIVELPVNDVSQLPEPYVEAYRFAQHEVEAPFDLREAPLFRAHVIRVTPDDHVLLCTMHHIVTDSWSMQIMARELEAAYSAFSHNTRPLLADLPIGYGDYSEWQQHWLDTDDVQKQLTYWRGQLQKAPPLLDLPRDGQRPSEQTFGGESKTVQLPDEALIGIKQLASHWQTTPFLLLLAAFKVLLYRYSAQPDVLVGVPVAGRNRVETEGLIGFFVNTLVLRDNLSGNPKFSDLVLQVRETAVDAFANADVPFEKVVEVVKPDRNLSYNPIFQIMFSVIKAAVQSHTFGDLTAFPYVVTPTSSIFDLSATLIEGLDGLWWVQIDYNSNLFHSVRMDQMLRDYIAVVQRVVANPETRLSELPVTGVDSGQRTEYSQAKPVTIAKSAFSPLPASRLDNGGITGQERVLLEIWKEVLENPNVGTRDNFFDVGGHSLLAARLMSEIERATGRKIPVSAIFRAPTIESFASLLEAKSVSGPDPLLMKLGDGGFTTPVFAVATPGVDTLGFAHLAHRLSPLHATYKLQASSPIISGRPFTDEELDSLSQQYLSAMRSIQPHGPYCLGSMCEGVLVAQKMILQLESEGEEVAFLAILDTWVMENTQIKSLWALDYYVQRFRYWRSRPFDEQLATVRRTLSRKIRLKRTATTRGWEQAFWPGEDFQAPRFRAPVLLFKRPRQPYYHSRDPQMGWGERSLGGVEVCEIECGHVEMLREPYVRIVSDRLKDRIRLIMSTDASSAAGSMMNGDASASDSGNWAGSPA